MPFFLDKTEAAYLECTDANLSGGTEYGLEFLWPVRGDGEENPFTYVHPQVTRS